MPLNSEPEIHGKGGWCWYRPWTCRMSKKLAAEAWMRMRYSEGLGEGEGRLGVTVRSSRDCGRLVGVVGLQG